MDPTFHNIEPLHDVKDDVEVVLLHSTGLGSGEAVGTTAAVDERMRLVAGCNPTLLILQRMGYEMLLY